ncbi:hypothetical protein CPB83DRAFT_503496 [Crepidotus variabilis]|uniref:G domain-containing protein n=1 Tax=Crepidotus variabilis TaxID=179855 RepID=A0A9P6JMU2_9AGAR|nr:hypothetical protein CPB83DRAFT_503496 [Crepidotus variabilis]
MFKPFLRMFGNSGSGKSTFINTAANASLAIGGGMEPCTKAVTFARMKLPVFTDRDIVLIDTPGLDTSTDLDDHNVATFLRKRYGKKVTPAGILYFQDLNSTSDLSAGRKMWSSLESPETVASWPRMRLVTTRWDEMDLKEIEVKEKAVLTQFLEMAVYPDLIHSRFDQTQEMAVRILLPFIRSANAQADCRLLEEISKGGMAEVAALKDLAVLLEQQRILLHKLCQDPNHTNSLNDGNRRATWLNKHKENGETLRSKTAPLRLYKVPKRSASMFNLIGSWVTPVNYLEHYHAVTEVEKLRIVLESVKDVSPDNKVFLVLGTAGSGKSQLISDCIGDHESPVVNASLIAEDKVQPIQLFKGTLDKSDVFFIDTPGFSQADRISDADIVLQVTSWLVVMHHKRVRLAGVLFLHSLSVDLTPKQFLPCKGLLSKCLDEEVPVILATTQWDQEIDEDIIPDEIDYRESRLKEDCWHGLIESGATMKRLGRMDSSSDSPPEVDYESAVEVIGGLIAKS